MRIAYRRAFGSPEMPDPEFLADLAHELKNQLPSNVDQRDESELFYEYVSRGCATMPNSTPGSQVLDVSAKTVQRCLNRASLLLSEQLDEPAPTSRKHAMRRRGGKNGEAASMAPAIADLRSASPGRGGRCEPCWGPGCPTAPSCTL